jgi:hypothetical protein
MHQQMLFFLEVEVVSQTRNLEDVHKGHLQILHNQGNSTGQWRLTVNLRPGRQPYIVHPLT